ncbi:MAG: hypothetical protein IT426_12640 [Pirellulales bacterium]|nr:hypothetical protein [Pirellulales bacterium]
MPKRGRPPVLDQEKRRDILTILTVGCSRRTAARYVDCAPSTIRNTAERDAEFTEKLAKAENSSEVMHLRNINAAAKDPRYWRASAWALERLRPEFYGSRNPEIVTPDRLAELLAQVAETIVAEVPVDRYRKNILKILEEVLREFREK